MELAVEQLLVERLPLMQEVEALAEAIGMQRQWMRRPIKI